MTTRTLVGYWRVCWSWLMTGAAKDRTTLSPSCAAPSKCDEKNKGQLNMANPYIADDKNNFGMANPFTEQKASDIAKELRQSDCAVPRLVHIQWSNEALRRYPIMVKWSEPVDAGTVPSSWLCDDENGGKFKKQISLFVFLKNKRKK